MYHYPYLTKVVQIMMKNDLTRAGLATTADNCITYLTNAIVSARSHNLPGQSILESVLFDELLRQKLRLITTPSG